MSYLFAFAAAAILFFFAASLLPVVLPLILFSLLLRMIFRPNIKVYTTSSYSNPDLFRNDSWNSTPLPPVEKRKPLEDSIDADFTEAED